MSEQRTEDWFLVRAGKFTGSKFVDVMARNKKTGEPLKAYHDLIMQLVVERMTGQPVEGPTGQALKWGTEVEPYAREAYELETGEIVRESGFIIHPVHAFVGCSPDGLIGSDGGLEMKCPKDSAVHLERFEKGMPDEYIGQTQGCMWVTGRKWWDFVSYDPRMPESHRIYIQRIERDEKYIADLEQAVITAEAIVQQKLESLIKKAA
jgi:putative phage-type endonuclease